MLHVFHEYTVYMPGKLVSTHGYCTCGKDNAHGFAWAFRGPQERRILTCTNDLYWLLLHVQQISGCYVVEVLPRLFHQYSGPCDLRPFHLIIPSILRPAISDTPSTI